MLDSSSPCAATVGPTAHPAQPLFNRLAAAARQCAREIGLPVVIEADELAAFVCRETGAKVGVPTRQQLGGAAGLHPFPRQPWHYWDKAPLRVFCTAPTDPRPQAMWDECLWLTPQRLLQQGEVK